MPDRLDKLLAIWDEHGSTAAYAQLKRFITEDKIKATEQDRCARCGISRDLGGVSCRDADPHVWEQRRVEEPYKYPPCDHTKRPAWAIGYCEECAWERYQRSIAKAAERCVRCGGKMDGSAPFCSGGCDAVVVGECVHSWAKIDGEWRCRHCPETSVVDPHFIY